MKKRKCTAKQLAALAKGRAIRKKQLSGAKTKKKTTKKRVTKRSK